MGQEINRIVRGNKGFQGHSGFRGLQGLDGNQGKQGYSGYHYRIGIQSDFGPQGLPDIGVQGNQGDEGSYITAFSGYQGLTGNPQLVGFQGNQGLQGKQGNQAKIGYQGWQGFQGSQGQQGLQGLWGIQNEFIGSQGPQGNQGPQGFQGNQGSQGYIGNQGSTTIGNTGLIGRQGLLLGPRGNQGVQGLQGFQGPTANNGSQGSQGSDFVFDGYTYSVIYDDFLGDSVNPIFYINNGSVGIDTSYTQGVSIIGSNSSDGARFTSSYSENTKNCKWGDEMSPNLQFGAAIGSINSAYNSTIIGFIDSTFSIGNFGAYFYNSNGNWIAYVRDDTNYLTININTGIPANSTLHNFRVQFIDGRARLSVDGVNYINATSTGLANIDLVSLVIVRSTDNSSTVSTLLDYYYYSSNRVFY